MRRGGRRSGRSSNPSFTSNCGNVKVRGNAKQVAQSYEKLAKEAEDGTEAESFRQHAEHYNREFDRQRRERDEQVQDGSMR